MATYPNGTYAPASKSNGQIIQASFFNDPENEIVAIEDALRTGIPHAVTISTGGLTVSTGSVNVGGPSSLTTLQVTGGSTFAGPVTFSSGVTFSTTTTFAAPPTLSSGATVSTGVIRQNSLPMWNVFHSTFVAVAANSSVGLAFDSQSFVRGNIEHSTTTNSSRVTINTTGVYQINAHAVIAPSAAGNSIVTLHLRQNDSTNLVSVETTPLAAATVRDSVTLSHAVRIDSTCYLSCVLVSSAFGSTAGSSATNLALRFSGFFIG